ncbi:hypothetical protein [Paenibacillus sp. FSL W7-1287]|uniref:hypothetical protein n=1 Tax=Paenibacillus sp. FSL W7-1287 TaxID=2954538 RepID=UPI0030F5B223
MSYARNFVIYLWLALASAFVRNIGLSDGLAAIFGSVFLMFMSLVLLGVTLLYFILRPWLRSKTAVEPSLSFLKLRRTLRFVPVIPTVLFFLFTYNTEYGDYVKTYRDMNPTGSDHFLDSLGSTLSLTFVFYALFELILFTLLWQKRKEQVVS